MKVIQRNNMTKEEREGDFQEKWSKNWSFKQIKTTTVQVDSTLWTCSDIWIHLAPGSRALPCPFIDVTLNVSFNERTGAQTKHWILWFIHFFASDIFCSLSSLLPRTNGSGFSFCDKSSTIVCTWFGFLCTFQYWETGWEQKNKKPKEESFLSLNYHCMILNYVELSDHCIWMWIWPHSIQTHSRGWVSLPCHSLPSANLLGNESLAALRLFFMR